MTTLRGPPPAVRESAPEPALATPRAVALGILAARFGEQPVLPDAGASRIFDLADFQKDAVAQAQVVLRRRRGVLVSDSVGLGKTFIGLALAERALRRGETVLVTAPASIRSDWVRHLRDLTVSLGLERVWGAGPVPVQGQGRLAVDDRRRCDAQARKAAPGDPGLGWISHTGLARGMQPPDWLTRPDLVIVDEAHVFRSPDTKRYRTAAGLCRTARVVLLTATPVNNSVMDLYHQLRLFSADDAFRDVGVPDLEAAFRRADDIVGAADHTLACRQIEPVVRAVMIRRTRPFLRRHYQRVRVPASDGPTELAYPRRAPPSPVRYAFRAGPDGERDVGFLASVARGLGALSLAPYRLGAYGCGERADDGRVELFRLHLLKRVESSVAALRASLRRLQGYLEAFVDALDRDRLVTPAEHRLRWRTHGDGDPAQLVLDELTAAALPARADAAELRRDVLADLDRLRRLRERLDGVGPDRDGKLRELLGLLDGDLCGEKVVVFCGYRDTARYLWRAMRRRPRIGLVDGAGAFLGSTPATRLEVIRRFAPRANGAPAPTARERVDVLLATDVLSQGLNLHDAGCVISYDLPWNPIRLIQRVGRVDRLGSMRDTVRSYHFLPGAELEGVLRLVGRIERKLMAIRDTVGAEAAVLGAEEGAAGGSDRAFIDRLARGDPDVLEDIERGRETAAELEQMLRLAFREALGADHAVSLDMPEATARARYAEVPMAVLRSRSVAGRCVLAAFRSRCGVCCVVVNPADGAARCDDRLAAGILLEALEASETDGGRSRSPELQARRVLLGRVLEQCRAALDGDPASGAGAMAGPPGRAAADAASLLLHALASVPGDADPGLCHRADRLLRQLARRTDVGTELAIAGAVEGHRQAGNVTGGREAEALVRALERVLAPRPRNASAARTSADGNLRTWEPVGVIELGPAEPVTGGR